jgi:hypothetical protein
MQIHDREWCNLFYWSEEQGSCMAHIKRDRGYWALLHQVRQGRSRARTCQARSRPLHGRGLAAAA